MDNTMILQEGFGNIFPKIFGKAAERGAAKTTTKAVDTAVLRIGEKAIADSRPAVAKMAQEAAQKITSGVGRGKGLLGYSEASHLLSKTAEDAFNKEFEHSLASSLEKAGIKSAEDVTPEFFEKAAKEAAEKATKASEKAVAEAVETINVNGAEAIAKLTAEISADKGFAELLKVTENGTKVGRTETQKFFAEKVFRTEGAEGVLGKDMSKVRYSVKGPNGEITHVMTDNGFYQVVYSKQGTILNLRPIAGKPAVGGNTLLKAIFEKGITDPNEIAKYLLQYNPKTLVTKLGQESFENLGKIPPLAFKAVIEKETVVGEKIIEKVVTENSASGWRFLKGLLAVGALAGIAYLGYKVVKGADGQDHLVDNNGEDVVPPMVDGGNEGPVAPEPTRPEQTTPINVAPYNPSNGAVTNTMAQTPSTSYASTTTSTQPVASPETPYHSKRYDRAMRQGDRQYDIAGNRANANLQARHSQKGAMKYRDAANIKQQELRQKDAAEQRRQMAMRENAEKQINSILSLMERVENEDKRQKFFD